MIHDSQIYYDAENGLRDWPDGFCYSGGQVPNSADNVWLIEYIFYCKELYMPPDFRAHTGNSECNGKHTTPEEGFQAGSIN